VDESSIIVGEFGTPLSVMDKCSRQKISNNIVKYTTSHLDLVDIYRLLHPTTANYAFYWSSHAISTKTNYIIGHKADLNKFKRIKII
jgi:hypothetical protein